MNKYHIIGINRTSIKIYLLLKKKKFKTTISDIKDISSIKKKIKLTKFGKDFFFKEHPKKILNDAKYIIFSTGVIRNLYDYKNYLKNRKNISEIDFFFKSANWPKKNILFVTGSRGKTSVCKNIFKNLVKEKIFKKIFYLDRNTITFSALPKYQDGFFLIAEVDYQSLLIAKYINAKFRIFTNFFKSENRAFKQQKLYKYAKLKIFNNLKNKDFVLVNNLTFMKLKSNIKRYQNNIVIFQRKKSTKETNYIVTNNFLKLIKKEFSVKN